VVYFSLEMSERQLREAYGLPEGVIVDETTHTTVADVARAGWRHHSDLIIIDYVQLMTDCDAASLQRLKDLVDSTGVDVLVASQVHPKVAEERRLPRPDELLKTTAPAGARVRGLGYVEYYATWPVGQL
jgi:hypothetical protein